MSGWSRLIEQGRAHHEAGRLDQAAAMYRRALVFDPNNAQAFDALSQVLSAKGEVDAAIEAGRRAVRADPNALPLRERLANLLVAAEDFSQSVTVWREYVRHAEGFPTAWVGLARQLLVAHQPEEGLKVIQEAVRRFPDDSRVAYEAAFLNERMGNVQEAAVQLERALVHPHNAAETGMLSAKLDAQAGQWEAARARLRSLAETAGAAMRGEVHNELARVLDRLGDSDGAFAAAAAGRKLAFDALPVREQDLRPTEKGIRLALELSGEQVERWPSRPRSAALPAGVPEVPVFIVGFPRSGTTLIEQMLAAHPRLLVTDELRTLQLVRQRMYERFGPRREYPTDLGEFTESDIGSARKWYIEQVYKNLRGPEGEDGASGGAERSRRRVVDKHPMNTLDMSFVRRIFPESPVIYVMRDPRDTVLSVFMQGFVGGNPHLFSLEGTARLYDLFARVWEHYEKVLGLRTMRVRYEDLVADPEREARRMLEFIGEPWDEAVLNYHAPEHRRFVATPSYADVAKPIYKRAMGRWKKYEKQLTPVLPVLEPWVRAWGYE